MWRWPASVLLAAVAVAMAVWWAPRVSRGDSRPTIPESLDPPPTVHALGRLEPRGEVVAVAAPSGAGDARIAELLVREGDPITAGQLLAVLDNASLLEAACDVARAAVEQAAAKLERTRIDVAASREELAAVLEAAQARLRTARTKAERESVLLRDNATSRDAYDEAALELERATQAIFETEAKLARYEKAASGQAVDVAVAQADLELARATLAEAEANRSRSRVVSPLTGVVLDVSLRPGEPVAGAALLQVGAVDEMMARLDVYESDTPRLAVGQPVELSAPALSQPLLGAVESVGALVKKQSVVDAAPAANTDARVVEVMVKLDEASSRRAARFVEMQVRAEVVVR